jgi:hypothetical protein
MLGVGATQIAVDPNDVRPVEENVLDRFANAYLHAMLKAHECKVFPLGTRERRRQIQLRRRIEAAWCSDRELEGKAEDNEERSSFHAGSL